MKRLNREKVNNYIILYLRLYTGDKINAHFSICEVFKLLYKDLLDNVQIRDQHHGSLPLVVP